MIQMISEEGYNRAVTLASIFNEVNKEKAKESIKKGFKNVMEVVSNAIDSLKETFKSLWDQIKNMFVKEEVKKEVKHNWHVLRDTTVKSQVILNKNLSPKARSFI